MSNHTMCCCGHANIIYGHTADDRLCSSVGALAALTVSTDLEFVPQVLNFCPSDWALMPALGIPTILPAF